MIQHLFIAVGVALFALCTAWLLVPGGEELALMHMKDGKFRTASKRFELELSKQGLKRYLVSPMVELKLRSGDIDAAIELTESYLQTNPTDVPILEALVDYYEQGQRMVERVGAMQRLADVAPTASRLRELAFWYRLEQRPAQETEALRRLALGDGARAQDVMRLSELLAGSGDLAGAALALDDLWLKAPERFDSVALTQYTLLQLELEEPQEALARARAWIALNPDPEAALALAAEFSLYEQPGYGLVLLRALPQTLRARADIRRLTTELRVASGEGEAVFEELLAMERSSTLSEAQLTTLVELALSEGRHLIATERAKLLPIEKLPEWTLTSLVHAALQAGQAERAAELFDAIRPQVLAGNPLLAAQLAHQLRRNRAAVRWAVLAESKVEGPQRVALANLFVELDLLPRAKRLVIDIDPAPLEPPVVATLARLYLRFGEAQTGLAALESSGDTSSESWALLALAAGADERVDTWLARVANSRLSDAGFGELYELAASREQFSLADRLAVRGYGLFGNPIWRLRLAEQRLRIGQPEAALALLEGLDHRRLKSEYLYRRALLTAHEAGAEVRDALRILASDASQRYAAGSAEAKTIAYEFLAAGADIEALPLLRKLAACAAR